MLLWVEDNTVDAIGNNRISALMDVPFVDITDALSSNMIGAILGR